MRLERLAFKPLGGFPTAVDPMLRGETSSHMWRERFRQDEASLKPSSGPCLEPWFGAHEIEDPQESNRRLGLASICPCGGESAYLRGGRRNR